MTKKWPAYSPLKITFDADRLRTEVLATEEHWKSLAPAKRYAQSPQYFEVAPPECYADCEYIEKVGKEWVHHPGKSTWKGISLRHMPGIEKSRLGSNRYRFTGDGDDWVWDERFTIPYTRELVSSLPYVALDIVRVMSVSPGGFGPVHIDEINDNPCEKFDLLSTTFTIDYGGSHMQAQHEGNRFETDAPAFLFKDFVPHGVPPVTSRRLILRINGKADPDCYRELIDTDRAIW
jgi:hypothetical protein